MKLKEIVIISSLVGTGSLLLGLAIGFMPAIKLLGMVLGGWLLFAGIDVLISRVSMEAKESLDQAKAERRGENMAHMAFAARDKKESIEDERVNGKIVGGY